MNNGKLIVKGAPNGTRNLAIITCAAADFNKNTTVSYARYAILSMENEYRMARLKHILHSHTYSFTHLHFMYRFIAQYSRCVTTGDE